MQGNEKNKRLDCSLSMVINCISEPVLVVDSEDKTVDVRPISMNNTLAKFSPNATAGES